ncbi:alpha/beta fold hydrolase [Dactylosporangium fulvum]|uniref:Alpha/beta fold hydrolase n=1 Tax=Dactylosporangium fulvum TaxID=53359 RepID=A0ABY5VVM5_9ACTN|nr:alpha/beta fold hydrolase [Dactylosporangium fulvum]UWP81156.1 alpha/beta fold hydrolase [Dactylosporangium fulvum]
MEPSQEYLDRGTDQLALFHYPFPDSAPTMAVLWPAMGVPARYYRRFAAQLTAAGLAVTVVDLRGTGASSPRPSRASRYGLAELTDDVDAVLEHLKPVRAGRRTLLVGHSLGGQACALHLAARGATSDVAGLALLAVGLPYWRSYARGRQTRILAMTQTLAAGSALLGVWPGWAFGGRQARGVIRDWAFTARVGRYPRLDGVDVEAALARVTTPVLAVDMEGDQYTPPGTVDKLTSKLTSAKVLRERYSAAEAGGPIDHFTWAKSGAALAGRVAAWSATL